MQGKKAMSTYKHILVAIDFSDLSKQLVARAVQLGNVFGSQITVVHAVDYIPPVYLATELPNAYSSSKDLTTRAESMLDELVGQFKDVNIGTSVDIGTAKSVLNKTAANLGADLLIVGKQDPTAVDRILGTTAASVINKADVDVLVIRA